MTNQIALRSLLIQPPHSVLCDIEAHIHCYEAGGIAYHSQANTLAIKPRNGYFLTLEDDVIPNIILSEDQHVAPVSWQTLPMIGVSQYNVDRPE